MRKLSVGLDYVGLCKIWVLFLVNICWCVCLKYLCNMVIIINVYFVGLFIVVYVNNDWMFMGIVLRLYVFILKKKMFYKYFYFCILWIFCYKNIKR